MLCPSKQNLLKPMKAKQQYLNACDTSTKMDLWRRRKDIAIEYLWYKADLERIGGGGRKESIHFRKYRVGTFTDMTIQYSKACTCTCNDHVNYYLQRSAGSGHRKWAHPQLTYLAQASGEK